MVNPFFLHLCGLFLIMTKKYNGFGSTAIHAGQRNDIENAHITPIFATSTYVFDNATQARQRFTGEDPGYIYGRFGSPSITEAEEKIAALETFGFLNSAGQEVKAKAILHSSGMSALTTLFLSTLKKGDSILSHFSLYGGTAELFNRVMPELGIEVIIDGLRDLDKVEALFKKNGGIKMLYLETPANPTLKCVDIKALTTLAKKYGALVACDNTFATPYLQQPFKYGVDYIMHSTTKFLNGHGTAIGGVLISTDVEFMNTKGTKWHRLLGGNSNGFDAFVLSNGIKTLEVRMERHCHNAMEVAHFLNDHSAISKVNYLGLPEHPDFYVANKQMNHPGGMLSFELKNGYNACTKFLDKLQLCIHAVSLGTVDTLLTHPASTTHVGIPKEDRAKYEITDGLIRMSVGIENIQDILNDLDQALK
jgi:methionine-gamma-lyase